jgi:hypothetical protein
VTAANTEAFTRLTEADPVLIDVRQAGEVVPDMTPATILTSGAPLPWEAYYGGQRRAVLAAAVHEELAADVEEADQAIRAGRIRLGACHDHGCVGSVAGIYTASMPVLVVESARYGNRGFCNLYEGESRKRLNYGIYDDEVRRGLDYLAGSLGPLLGRPCAVRAASPWSRSSAGPCTWATSCTAATPRPPCCSPASCSASWSSWPDGWEEEVVEALAFLRGADYFFLRCSMAAAKVLADAAGGVAGSSLVTAMTISCREYAVRVSGCGDRWFRGPLPTVEAKLFEGFTPDDIEWIGGESHITETVGLGGFAQAAAFGLQAYQGGGPEAMVASNLAMYDITHGEHPHFNIPYLGFRGTPTGIDVHKVVATGVVPVIDGGLAGRDGGQIGAGILKAPLECFLDAAAALRGPG